MEYCFEIIHYTKNGVMSAESSLDNKELFDKVKLISNNLRFRILELTQVKKLSITELSTHLQLSYTKCADYVSLLEKHGLVNKEKNGRLVMVRSRTLISGDQIVFGKKL